MGVKFKVIDSRKRLMSSMTTEQEEYLHRLKIEDNEEKLSESELTKTDKSKQQKSTHILEDTPGHSKEIKDFDAKVSDDEEEQKGRQVRLEAVADAKINLELIRAELKRVKNRVKGSKRKKGKKLKKKDKADTEEMIRLEREVEKMAKEVKEIEAETSFDEGDSDKKKK